MKECEDAISREEALNKMKTYYDDCAQTSEYTRLGFETAMNVVKELPSVYPKAKVGKWVTWSEEIKCDGYTEYRTRCKCSECDKEHDSYFSHFIKYCSNCGAKMEGVKE